MESSQKGLKRLTPLRHEHLSRIWPIAGRDVGLRKIIEALSQAWLRSSLGYPEWGKPILTSPFGRQARQVSGPLSWRILPLLCLRHADLAKVPLRFFTAPLGRGASDPVSPSPPKFIPIIPLYSFDNFQGFGTAKEGNPRFFLRRI
jgi:hypothetical protein